jgi:hypothetical protein
MNKKISSSENKQFTIEEYKSKQEEDNEIMVYIANTFINDLSHKNSNPINKIIDFFKSKSNQLINTKIDNKSLFNKEDDNKNEIKKCCSCVKSHCLKLYCDCFKKENYCLNCTCPYCLNQKKYEIIRQKSISYLKTNHLSKPNFLLTQLLTACVPLKPTKPPIRTPTPSGMFNQERANQIPYAKSEHIMLSSQSTLPFALAVLNTAIKNVVRIVAGKNQYSINNFQNSLKCSLTF